MEITTVCPPYTRFQLPRKPIPPAQSTNQSEKAEPYPNLQACKAPSYSQNDPVEQCFQEEVRMSNSHTTSICSSCPHKNNQRSRNMQCLRNVLREFWLWECWGCLFSLICLTCIIGVLVYENGRRVDQWPLAISPTAVVSFIATLAKGALVMVLSRILSQLKWLNFEDDRRLNQLKSFDFASRGPLGSFKLLWTSKRFLASIAAFLMLLTLLFDPFFQIVFSFPSEGIADPTQRSTFSNSSVFDPFGGKKASRIADSIVVSVHNGLNDGNVSEAFNCPSGLCIWPEDIKTLAVCGSCNNVTGELWRVPVKEGTGQNMGEITYAYKFPSGQFIYATGYPGKRKNSTGHLAQTDDIYFPSTLWNSTIINGLKRKRINSEHVHSNDSIVAFQVLRLPPMGRSATDLPPAQGYECELCWCEKTFRHVRAAGGHLTHNTTFQKLRYVRKSEDYTSFNYLSLADQVSEYRNSKSPSRSPYRVRDNDQLHDYLVKNVTSFSFGGTLVPQGLLQPPQSQLVESHDINATVIKLGETLTEMVRHQNSTAVLGHTKITVAFIRVKWEWLSLPLSLLFATSILLAVVASKSHSSRIAVWKDDPLALLFHRIDGIDRSLLSSRTHIRPTDIEVLVDKMVVRLSTDSLTFTKSDLKENRSSAISLF